MEHEGVNEIVDDELILDIDILMAEADRRQEEAVAAAVAEATKTATAEAEATQSKLIAKLRSLGVSEEEISELTK